MFKKRLGMFIDFFIDTRLKAFFKKREGGTEPIQFLARKSTLFDILVRNLGHAHIYEN